MREKPGAHICSVPFAFLTIIVSVLFSIQDFFFFLNSSPLLSDKSRGMKFKGLLELKRASLVAQMVRHLPAMGETRV